MRRFPGGAPGEKDDQRFLPHSAPVSCGGVIVARSARDRVSCVDWPGYTGVRPGGFRRGGGPFGVDNCSQPPAGRRVRNGYRRGSDDRPRRWKRGHFGSGLRDRSRIFRSRVTVLTSLRAFLFFFGPFSFSSFPFFFLFFYFPLLFSFFFFSFLFPS